MKYIHCYINLLMAVICYDKGSEDLHYKPGKDHGLLGLLLIFLHHE